jgi:aspartyl-tRNA(Asn)/glutamyl-tRNA(Gln) amidotransferase subunit A
VAARTCLGALGTDTGGPIRLPSAVNGIVGIRPTIGRVSNHNVVPLAWTMDTVSPMTRTVEDCFPMFEVIAGWDPLDPHSAQGPVANYRAELGRGIRGLRIGLIVTTHSRACRRRSATRSEAH